MRLFEDGGAFDWRATENSEKSWCDDFFFLEINKNSGKSRPTQKFWPPQNEILPPLEQRSSCGTAIV